ncbi:hypothetical protein [Krasilnikovia sp. MM14-A1259]|uniref:hypothetical protein n=1 Tax=Krasilnikovia sp. MM14-A1259 TaxID=3373539 RepID=UPI00399CB27C
MRSRIVAAVAVGALAVLPAAPALAATSRTFATSVSAVCDTSTAEWIVDWAITNQSDTTALLIVVESTPTASRLESLPATAGGATTHAIQRIPGDSPGARLSYIAVWTDYPGGSYMSTTEFTAPGPCERA